jgi:DNA-binding beta-propeller fold protein YncE
MNMRRGLSIVAVLGLGVLCRAQAQGCEWKESPPDTVGTRHAFQVTCSPQGLSYAWDFGDGNQAVSEGPSIGHAYAGAGQYIILVRIAMPEGDTLSVVGGQTVVHPLTRGRPRNAGSILFDTAQSRIWTVNPDNHSVVHIDWPSRVRSREFPVGRKPRTLALDSRGGIWVCSQDGASLSILDSKSGELLHTLALPRASRPFAVVVDPVRDVAYVTLQATGRLLKFDAAGRRLLGDLEVTPSARGLAVTGDGNRILVSRFISGPDAGEIVEVDAATFSVARRYPLAYDQTPDTDLSGSGVPNAVNSIAITPDGREAWFTAKKDNVKRGVLLDGRAFTEENTVRTFFGALDLAARAEVVSRRQDLDNRNMAKAIAFTHKGVYAFVATEGSNSVDVYNVPGFQRTGSIDPLRLDQELAPQGLAVHPNDSLLFVQYFTSREVGVYDISTAGSLNAFTLTALIKTVETDSLTPQEALGQQVFYNSADVRMTRSNYVSCSTCHMDGASDERVWDFTERGEGLRNTTTLLGKGGPGGGPFHWSANFDEIQDFEHDIRGPQKGLGFLTDVLFQEGTRGTTLGDPKAGHSVELDALTAFIHTLTQAPPSPFRAANGGLTPGALRGREVFRSSETGCAKCHAGPRFTDSGLMPGDPASAYAPFHAALSRPGGFVLHDVGTLKPSSGKRMTDTLEGLDTPTLQGVWATAPYLHDGSAASLMEVIDGRNPGDRHGKTSHLSKQQKEDLVDYLLQIDGTPEDGLAVRPPRAAPGGFAGRVRSDGRIVFAVTAAGLLPTGIAVYDAKGGRQARLGGRGDWQAIPGGWELEWDGRGASGRRLPPGIYWARLSLSGQSHNLRLILGGIP